MIVDLRRKKSMKVVNKALKIAYLNYITSQRLTWL